VLYVQNQIEVVDYKFGKIKVEVDDNEQLKYYALSFAPLAPKAKGVTVHIVQPFVDNIESVFLTADDLDTFRQQSVDHEKQILAGDVTFGPSDHCKFCPANPHGRGIKGKPYCPALMQLYYPQVLDVDDALR
jgi:RecB family exonuclease